MVERKRFGCMLRTVEAYNLSPDTTLLSARPFFEKMGKVESVSLMEKTAPTEDKKIVCASVVFHRSEDALKAVKEFSSLKRESREVITLSLSHGHMLKGMQKRLEGMKKVGSHCVMSPSQLTINPSNDIGGGLTTRSPSPSTKQYTGTVLSLSPEQGNGLIRADFYRKIKLLFQLSEVESRTPLKVGDRVKYSGWRNEDGLWLAADVINSGPTMTFYSPKNEKRNSSHVRCCPQAISHEWSKTPPNSRIPKGGSPYFNAQRDNDASNRVIQHITSRGPFDSDGFGAGRGSRINSQSP